MKKTVVMVCRHQTKQLMGLREKLISAGAQ